MRRKSKPLIMPPALAVFLCVMLLAGCGSGGTPSQVSLPPTNGASSQSSGNPSTTGGTFTGQGMRPGGANMEQVIAKAASILGVSTDELTAAYDEARTSVFGSTSFGQLGGAPPSGGTPPTGEPPSGGAMPPGVPTNASGQQHPQRPSGADDMMTKLYAKIGQILGISTDDVTSAFDQAMSEVMGQPK